MFGEVDLVTGSPILQTFGILGGIITVGGVIYGVAIKLINIGVEKNKYENLCKDVTDLKEKIEVHIKSTNGDMKLMHDEIYNFQEEFKSKVKIIRQEINLVKKFQVERGINESAFKGHIHK